MLRYIASFGFLLIFLTTLDVFAIEFRYQHNEGDQFRYIASATSEVGWEGETLESSDTVNRIAFTIQEVNATGAHYVGTMQSSEQQKGQSSASLWSREYKADYWKNDLGIDTVDAQYFAPMVRSIPSFPQRDVAEGESWLGRGEEVQDLSKVAGISAPFHIPILVNYRYIGPVVREGKTYQLIEASYQYSQTLPSASGSAGRYSRSTTTTSSSSGSAVPQRLLGKFAQKIYWDAQAGYPGYYIEEYQIRMEYSDRSVRVSRGTADAVLLEAKPMDKKSMMTDMREQLDAAGLQDVQLAQNDKGITLVMDNILFESDSSRMVPGQEDKLKSIGTILKQYHERDVQVVGHTAKTNNDPNNGVALSTARAKTVADYFVKNQYRTSDRLLVDGRGAKEPIADNSTAEGKAKNRRVEITLLEN